MEIKETIKRSKHDTGNPYFMMNRNTAQDDTLSWDARGVLAYLLSKPNDWEVMVSDLKQNCGRDKVRRILRELIDAGYLEEREKIIDPDTKKIIGYTPYIVHEKPWTGFQATAFQETANQATAKRPLHNKDLQNTEVKKKEKEKTTARKRAKSSSVPAEKMNPMKDAIASAFGWSWDTMTGNEAGMIQRTAKQLCEASLDPSDVSSLYKHVNDMGVTFNPPALANHVSNWRGTKPTTKTEIVPAEPLDVPNESETYEISDSERFVVENTPTFIEQLEMKKNRKSLKQVRAERDARLETPVTFDEQRQLIERDISIEELRGL